MSILNVRNGVSGPMLLKKNAPFDILWSSQFHIASGKSFSNPNFVNKGHPNKHNHKTEAVTSSSPPVEPKPIDIAKPKRRKNRRKSKSSRKAKHCNHNKDNILSEQIEMDLVYDQEPELVKVICSQSPKLELECLELIFPSPPKVESVSLTCFRARQVSEESEDSFVVFGECEELSELETDSDDEEEEGYDSTCSVIQNKKVRFAKDEKLCVVHPMVHWSFAYQAARKGPWEEHARDRERFKRRILDAEKTLNPILDLHLRERIFSERFRDKPE